MSLPFSCLARRLLSSHSIRRSSLPLARLSLKPPLFASTPVTARMAQPGIEGQVGFPSFSTVNFYAGNELNRLSWLRNDSSFLNKAIKSSNTRFILLQNLNPLVHADGSERDGLLATLGWDEIRETILDSVAMARGQAKGSKSEQEAEVGVFGPGTYGMDAPLEAFGHKEKAFGKAVEGLGPWNLALVFLGVDEGHLAQDSLPGQQQQQQQGGESGAPAGTPYFALSLTFTPPGYEGEELPTHKLEKKLIDEGRYDFTDTRALAQAGQWELKDAAVVAQARSLIDWNERQHFCPSCSRRQYSLWAGWKRGCASALEEAGEESGFVKPLLSQGLSFKEDGKGECPTTRLLSNFCYPRTDPTVIMAIVSPDGEKILLGRQRKWPPGFYSCLAGFLEPGESLEEAVRREIHEESGVKVGKVTYHSSQPWPFPANLMMGAIGQAIEGKDEIRLDLDNELEHAKFFDRSEVLAAIEASSNWTISKKDLSKFDVNAAAEEERKAKEKLQQAGGKWDEKDSGSVANVTDRGRSPSPFGRRPRRSAFKIPGPTAIAHVLIAAWARGEAHFSPSESPESLRTKM